MVADELANATFRRELADFEAVTLDSDALLESDLEGSDQLTASMLQHELPA